MCSVPVKNILLNAVLAYCEYVILQLHFIICVVKPYSDCCINIHIKVNTCTLSNPVPGQAEYYLKSAANYYIIYHKVTNVVCSINDGSVADEALILVLMVRAMMSLLLVRCLWSLPQPQIMTVQQAYPVFPTVPREGMPFPVQTNAHQGTLNLVQNNVIGFPQQVQTLSFHRCTYFVSPSLCCRSVSNCN